VDASNLHFFAHNEVWKGDREHIRNTILGEQYKEQVVKQIRESQALKDLQAKIAQEELETASKTEGDDLFQKLVDHDPALAALLSERDPVIHVPSTGGSDKGGEEGKSEFEGKYSPTFVRLEERLVKKELVIPVNRSRPVGARTDVENGYLQRADNKGAIVLDAAIREHFKVREQLKDGRLTIYLEPTATLKAGDEFTFRIGLVDPSMAGPIYSESTKLSIVEPEAPPQPKPKPKPNPKPEAGPGDNKPGEGDKKPTRGLPPYKLLTNDGREINGHATEQWPDGFTEYDGGDVRDVGDGNFVYLINYDNAYHIKYRLGERGQVAKDVVTAKYILGMRIVMLGFEHALREKLKGTDASAVAEAIDDMRLILARAAASTVLAIAENLPKIVDASSIQKDEVE
jgi:hypothetical protein